MYVYNNDDDFKSVGIFLMADVWELIWDTDGHVPKHTIRKTPTVLCFR